MSDDVTARVAAFMAKRDLFARHLGLELLELRPGFSRAGVTLAPYMLNGLGLPHGAAIFALADFAFAAACNSDGEAAVALSMDIHFLSSPSPGARLLAEAAEISGGQRTALYRMTVVDTEGELVAELHGMAYRKRSRFLEQPPQAVAQAGA
jgi:acyl-CoA thioesterase